MDWLTDLTGGLSQLGDAVNRYRYNTAYPEGNQPQADSVQSTASTEATNSVNKKIFGVPQNVVYIGGGVLALALIIMAVKK